MANVTITEIEDAGIAAVKAQCAVGVAPAGYVQTVDTFNGAYDAAFAELTIRLPCILFELEGVHKHHDLAIKGTAALGTKDEIRLNLLLGAMNLKSEKEGRRGTGGIYEMFTDVRTALEGQQLSLAIDAMNFEDFFRVDHEIPGLRLYQVVFVAGWKYRTGIS